MYPSAPLGVQTSAETVRRAKPRREPTVYMYPSDSLDEQASASLDEQASTSLDEQASTSLDEQFISKA